MQKGFVSLEYVLIFAGVLSVLSVTTIGITTLYSKNINAIDNYRLKEDCKEINQIIELLELMPQGIQEIELNNLESWTIEIKTAKELILKNKQKTCTIFSKQQITSITEINKNKILKITKQNNVLNIS